MGIETFYPEIAGIEEQCDLEKKMVSSDVISQADIKKYADYIIGELKLLKNKSEQEKQSFVIDTLSDNKIMGRVKGKIFSGDLDIDEAESAVRRVRQALVERLKGKIDEKIYLVVRDISIQNIVRENIISQLVDVESGQEKIYKDQELFGEDHGSDMREAFALFNKLSSHPNIVGIKEYDPANRRTIYEKLQMQDLKEYLYSSDQTKKNFLIGLKTIKDCLVGAEYLAGNGLILQDIKLNNLGLIMEEESVKGVLFDLEGLVKAGTKMKYRIFTPNHRPPEVPEKEVLEKEGAEIKSAEMVYQFGVSLEEILEFFEEIKMLESTEKDVATKLEDLSKKMREENPDKRIGLAEAKNELEGIIGKLK